MSQHQIKYKSFSHLFKIIVNIGLSPFYFGYINSHFNSINFDDIVKIYSIQSFSRSTAQGWITGCLSWAGCIGAFISYYLIANLSRKTLLKYLDYIILLNTLAIQIPNIWVLIGCRILQGLCIGIITSCAPLYIRQLLPNQASGSLGPMNQICIVFGVTFPFILSFFFSLIFSVQIYYRIVFGFPIVIVLIQIYNFKFNFPYQTPKYYLSKGQQQQARQLTKIIYKQQYVEEVLEQIKKSINKNKVTQLSTSQTQLKQMKRGKQIQQSLLQNQNPRQTKNKSVFKNSTLAIIMAYHLSIQQQFTGMGVLIAYSGQLMLIIAPYLQKIFPIFLHLTAITGCIGSILTLKYFGRKGGLVYGSISIGIFLLVIAFTFQHFDLVNPEDNSLFKLLIIISMILLIRLSFSFTLGPLVWLYNTEIVQPNIMPLATTINWITVSIVNTSFPILSEYFGGNPSNIFYFYGIYNILSMIINKILLVQTSNKTEQQIREQFEQKWKLFICI